MARALLSDDECVSVTTALGRNIRVLAAQLFARAELPMPDDGDGDGLFGGAGPFAAHAFTRARAWTLPPTVAALFTSDQFAYTWANVYGAPGRLALGLRFNTAVFAAVTRGELLRLARWAAGDAHEDHVVVPSPPTLLAFDAADAATAAAADTAAFRVAYHLVAPLAHETAALRAAARRSKRVATAAAMAAALASPDTLHRMFTAIAGGGGVSGTTRTATLTCLDTDMPAGAPCVELLTVPPLLAALLAVVRFNWAVLRAAGGDVDGSFAEATAMAGKADAEVAPYMIVPPATTDRVLTPAGLDAFVRALDAAVVATAATATSAATLPSPDEAMARALLGMYKAHRVPAGDGSMRAAAERLRADLAGLLRADMPQWRAVALRRGDVLVIPAATTFVRFTAVGTGAVLLALQLLDSSRVNNSGGSGGGTATTITATVPTAATAAAAAATVAAAAVTATTVASTAPAPSPTGAIDFMGAFRACQSSAFYEELNRFMLFPATGLEFIGIAVSNALGASNPLLIERNATASKYLPVGDALRILPELTEMHTRAISRTLVVPYLTEQSLAGVLTTPFAAAPPAAPAPAAVPAAMLRGLVRAAAPMPEHRGPHLPTPATSSHHTATWRGERPVVARALLGADECVAVTTALGRNIRMLAEELCTLAGVSLPLTACGGGGGGGSSGSGSGGVASWFVGDGPFAVSMFTRARAWELPPCVTAMGHQPRNQAPSGHGRLRRPVEVAAAMAMQMQPEEAAAVLLVELVGLPPGGMLPPSRLLLPLSSRHHRQCRRRRCHHHRCCHHHHWCQRRRLRHHHRCCHRRRR